MFHTCNIDVQPIRVLHVQNYMCIIGGQLVDSCTHVLHVQNYMCIMGVQLVEYMYTCNTPTTPHMYYRCFTIGHVCLGKPLEFLLINVHYSFSLYRPSYGWTIINYIQHSQTKHCKILSVTSPPFWSPLSCMNIECQFIIGCLQKKDLA